MFRLNMLRRNSLCLLNRTRLRHSAHAVGSDSLRRHRARHYTAVGRSSLLPQPGKNDAAQSRQQSCVVERSVDGELEGVSGHMNHVTRQILNTSSSSSSSVEAVLMRPDTVSTLSTSHTHTPPAFESVVARTPDAASSSFAKPDRVGTLWTAARVDELLSHYSYLDQRSTDAVTSTEIEEIRELVDYVTQTFIESRQHQMQMTAHQRQRVGAACRLACTVGFYKRCCELFFSSAEKKASPYAGVAGLATSRPDAGSTTAARQHKVGDGLPEYVIEAAVSAGEVRFLEQCFTLARESDGEEGIQSPQGQWTASAGVMHGLRVYCGCIRLLCNGHAAVTSSKASSELAQRIAVWLRLTPPGREPDRFVRASVRLSWYAGKSHRDGEGNAYSRDEVAARVRAAVFLQAFQHWRRTQPAVGGSAWLTASCLNALIWSATQAQRWDAASLYAMYVDLHLEGRKTLCPGADDVLIGTTLRYYLFSHQPLAGAAWLARLHEVFPGYLPSVATGSVMARVVGSASGGSPALALWCLEVFLNGNQPSPPTPSELFDCVCALARSDLPNYTAIVDSLAENELLTASPEETLYVKLLHCRGNVRWRGLLEGLLQNALSPASEFHKVEPSMTGTSGHHSFTLESPSASASLASVRQLLSPRNAYTILLVMQEGEHPLFITYYRFFLLRVSPLTSTAERARWATFAVVWATARAGRLGSEDVLFIAREVSQLLHPPLRPAGSTRDTSTIPTAVRRSLETKWAILYAQYSPAWWKRQGRSGQSERGNSWQRSRAGKAPSFSRQSIIAAPPASAEAAFPVARFLKKRTHLQLALAPKQLYTDTTWLLKTAGSSSTSPRASQTVSNRNAWGTLLSVNDTPR